MMATPVHRLLERDRELEALDAAEGTIVIEGAAGVGKTTLLAESATRARSAGTCVLSSRGAEIERELPYGIARQLLSPAVEGLSTASRDEVFAGAAGLAAAVLGGGGSVEPFAAMHGLYWLCANLAARQPLLLQVDDAQWADEPSLAWLAHAAARLDGMDVTIQLATRPNEGSALPPSPLAQLAAEPGTPVLALHPLGEASTAVLVRDTLDEAASDELCAACHAATGGNAFYLGELLAIAADERLTDDPAAATRVATLVPKRVRRAVLLRLARQGSDAVALARAVAVLGTAVPLRHAAALAGLTADDASVLADALSAAGILAGGRALDFAHPIVRGAVAEEMTAGALARAHRQAAEILHAEDADPSQVGVHALVAEATGDPVLVDALRRAAWGALARGSPSAALPLLRRALEEPPPREQRSSILAELAAAGRRAGSPGALVDLEAAIESATEPSERARLEVRLARWLFEQAEDRLDDAVDLYDRHGLAGEALAAAHMANRDDVEQRAGALRVSVDAGPDERAATAYVEAMGPGPAAGAARALRELAEVSQQGHEPPRLWAQMLTGLVATESFDVVYRLSERLLHEGRERGSLPRVAAGCTWRAHAHLRRGALAEAEADARTTIEATGATVLAYPAVAALADALLLAGRFEEADRVLERQIGAAPLDRGYMSTPLLSWARVKLAAGRLDDALALVDRCGVLGRRFSIGPGWLPWQATRALVLLRLGDSGARAAGVEALDAARRYGTAGCLGHGLRIAALTASDDAREAGLVDAVEVLEQSELRVELAGALIDLGAHMRRASRRVESREPLRRGLDLAARCGATSLVERAREEMLASGARPRRDTLSGRDALTPSELRVARLATDRSNPQIAQALFVTTKTVETHLGRVYRKLEISSRAELAEALGRAEASVEWGPQD